MNQRIWLFVLLVVYIASFTGFVQAQQPIENSKYYPGKEWRVSTPEEQGMDSRFLLDMFEKYGEKGRIIIVKNGYLVTHYQQSFLHKDVHHIHSCTKSIISALIGCAIEDGYIRNIHQNVLSFFPESRSIENQNAWKATLTLYHLLTMTSGMQWNDSVAPIDSNKMSNTSDWAGYVLNRPIIAEPGQIWNYNSGGSQLLSVILQKTTGQSAQDYARVKLFKPLGIGEVNWWKDSQGHSTAGWGLYLSSFDMAKLGYLFLREGRWNDKQVIPAQWVKESAKNHVPVESGFGRGFGYGYQWWVYTDQPVYAYKAWGGYGNHTVMMIIIPDQDMVVLLAGENSNDKELLRTFIFPSVKSSKSLPPNPRLVKKLKKAIDISLN